jgi:hypothetical protein
MEEYGGSEEGEHAYTSLSSNSNVDIQLTYSHAESTPSYEARVTCSLAGAIGRHHGSPHAGTGVDPVHKCVPLGNVGYIG